ncbi:ferredoxin reductase [Naumannella sp. ID2617S]|nr:ferredoxin reductase [Naumannella sp. ID2617S]
MRHSPRKESTITTTSIISAGARRLARALATPLVPADYLDLLDPLRPGGELRGRIRAVLPETADAATIVIRPGADWAGHRPGQYLRVGLDVDGVRQHRAYSITSRTDEPTLRITVKAIPGGVVSNHLVRTARAGDLLHLSQATGEFCQPETLPGKVLLLTAGSGITPVLGMLRNHRFTDAVLLHSSPAVADVIARSELEGYAAAGTLRLLPRLTDTEGLLRLDELDALVPDWREREVWACGPVGLLDAAEEHWAAAGLTERLHTERFRPAAFAAVGEGGTVTFIGTEQRVDAPGDRPLLNVAEEAGVALPSGCRMGICRGCLVPMRNGSVRDLRSGEVTTAEDEPVHVQTCVTAPAGDCRIDNQGS